MSNSRTGYAVYEDLFGPARKAPQPAKKVHDFSAYEVKGEVKGGVVKRSEKLLEMTWEVSEYPMADPRVWGPSFWFILHNGAKNYPEEPTPIVQEKMKGFIMGIPYMIPCQNCSIHANAFINEHYDKICGAVKSRKSLFCFFVDFHNYVNVRYQKKEFSCEDAWKLYSGSAKVMRMTYK